MWWLLTREVLRLRGSISREVPWDIMVDLYFYRDPNEEVTCPRCYSLHGVHNVVFIILKL